MTQGFARRRYYVRVPSTEKAVEALKANGGTLVSGPHEVPGGDIVAAAIDPQGAAFAVVQSTETA